MSTTTDDIMTSENEITQPRDISILLSLDTYQGMSDEEIDILIEYKCAQARMSAEVLASITAQTEMMEQALQDNKDGRDRALDMIQSLLDRGMAEVPVVPPKTVAPQSVEV